MKNRLDEDRAWSAPPADPPMSEYQRKILIALRETFPWPYSVFKVEGGLVNDAKLTWNPDFWVERRETKILVVKALDPDTDLESLDAGMKDAFAVMSVNYVYRDRIALSAPRGVVIVPDEIRTALPEDRYLAYRHAFEELDCQVISDKQISVLETHKNDET